jgi:hypothetical protein
MTFRNIPNIVTGGKIETNEMGRACNNNNNNNNNNLLTASGLSPGGSGYFTFKLRQTY